MIVSATERRNVLKLLIVSETACQLGVDVFRLNRDIRAGRVSTVITEKMLRPIVTEVDWAAQIKIWRSLQPENFRRPSDSEYQYLRGWLPCGYIRFQNH